MKNIFSYEITSLVPVISMWGDSYDTKALESIKRFDQFGVWRHHVGRSSKRARYKRTHRLSTRGQKPTHQPLSEVFRGSTRSNPVPSSFQTTPPRGRHHYRGMRIRSFTQWSPDAFLRNSCRRREDNHHREVPR